MTMTDPIADMLTRIRNANTAHFETVRMPGSKLKESLAAILVDEGYITGYQIDDEPGNPGKTLEITMKYSPDRERTISGIRRVSKPGLRIYARADRIPRVLGGLGVAVVSTSKGLMTDREARRRHIGGEVLCYVW
jgi:small subunit ribosomal protein S8